MRAVIQRVSEASVALKRDTLESASAAVSIGRGLFVLLGVHRLDTESQAELLAKKILNLRIFPDENERMNLSALDVRADLLVVSQFTLYADTTNGNRPSYTEAARPELAEPLYELFVQACKRSNLTVRTGVFRADMVVTLVNQGPVTIICDVSL